MLDTAVNYKLLNINNLTGEFINTIYNKSLYNMYLLYIIITTMQLFWIRVAYQVRCRSEFASNLFERANKRIMIIRSCGRTNSEPISLIAL